MSCCAGISVKNDECRNVFSMMTDPCFQKLCRIQRRQIYGQCGGTCGPNCAIPIPCPTPCQPDSCNPCQQESFCCGPVCGEPSLRVHPYRPIDCCLKPSCTMSNNKCPLPSPCCNPMPPCCLIVKPCQPRCCPSPCCPPPAMCSPACPQPDPRCCPKPMVVSFKCPTSVTPMGPNCGGGGGCNFGGKPRNCCKPKWDDSPARNCQPWSADYSVPCLAPLSQRYNSWVSSVPSSIDTNLWASRFSSRVENSCCQMVGVESPCYTEE